MPDFPRDRPHIVLQGKGKAEEYTTRKQPPRPELPKRDRAQHAGALRAALDAALAAVQATRLADPVGQPSGFYLDFELAPGSEHAAELLENRTKGIELVAMKQGGDNGSARATVFVPNAAAEHFQKRIEQYRTKETIPRTPEQQRNPKGQELVAQLESVVAAAVQSVFTDDLGVFPSPDEKVWWEVWLRPDHGDWLAVAASLDIEVQAEGIAFPDREVRLARADAIAMARLFVNSDVIAELRRAQAAPPIFLHQSNREQATWARDVADRLIVEPDTRASVCILDTGVTRNHPMLAPALLASDVHRYDPAWTEGDLHGHGTNMAGAALYGDLITVLGEHGPIPVSHRLESVKVLH